MKKTIITLIVICALIGLAFVIKNNKSDFVSITKPDTLPTPAPNPLFISEMKKKSYPGSNLVIEKTLENGDNFNRYIVSYFSDGLKQYALLTIPIGEKPKSGWPVILFNHGYIPPTQYSTENSYATFVNVFASSGFIVIKPDYRGNDSSEGMARQIYTSPDYATDSMNALASIKKYKDADPNRIGVWGHSMGGNITLHELVMTNEFKAAVFAAGVVGEEQEILDWWDKRAKARSITGNDMNTSNRVQRIIAEHGTPSSNPIYWNAIDPTKYISDITSPILIQFGSADAAVPPTMQTSFRDKLKNAGKVVEFHEYIGADHNLSPDTNVALNEAVTFFEKYLK